MRVALFFFIITFLSFGCEHDNAPITVVDPSQPEIHQGLTLAKFSEDTVLALVIVDSVARMVSVHSLSDKICAQKPVELIDLSRVRAGTENAELVLALFKSESHHVFINKLTDNAIGDVCCDNLCRSYEAYCGTGHLEYNILPWEEEELDSVYLPKPSAGDLLDIVGKGTVYKDGSETPYSYESNGHLWVDLQDREEMLESAKIVKPTK